MLSVAKKKSKPVSPWAELQRSVTQSWDERKSLIEKIQKHYNSKVVTFFATFRSLDAEISDDDAETLESILSHECDGSALTLIINSPGGQGMAAERIANVCRKYSCNQFDVIVPHMAKSAATMVCFGARKILMSSTAELGPVDPQVTYIDDHQKPHWISAAEYVRAYENLISNATSTEAARIEPYIQQLARYDSRRIEQLKSAQQLSEDISVSLLKTGMMSGKTDDEIKKSIDVFLTQQRTSSHGRMINLSGAQACGLSMEEIPLQSEVWKWIWKLFLSSDWVVMRGKALKLMETDETGLTMA